MTNSISRRGFAAAAAASTLAGASKSNGKLALLGGEPVRREPFPSWPKIGPEDEKAWMESLRGGKWFRGSGKSVEQFEQKYAELLGTKYCLATANGTSALYTALNALGVGPGDEVIVPPYTFVATINVVMLNYALPIFVDTDIDSFQIDHTKIEAAITDRTRTILPVHIGGSAANLDAIVPLGQRRKIPILEDACQAVLGEWRGRKLGSLGDAGCFSFQASKNLNSGEGGALVTSSEELLDKAYGFHNNGRARRGASGDFSYRMGGANLRMTEFQAALLMSQMTRLEEQSKRRDDNAAYLSGLLKEIPGITPSREYPGATRSGHHIYMFRYRKEAFAGVPRATFLKALAAEGVRGSGGYTPLNKQPFIFDTIHSKAYRALYPAKLLEQWEERTRCPVNDRLCEEAAWFGQTTLLATRRDMDQIAEAIRKIHAQAGELRKA